MAFSWVVRVDGSDLSPLVLEGASIEYGRQTLLDQPGVPVAVIELLTRDAYPAAIRRYPEFGLGDWATDLSGFTDDYQDEYAGVTSRITLGVPVEIEAATPSGFTDDYQDGYSGGVNFRRFTGRVQAIDYVADRIQLTCTPKSEAWARIDVGGTATGVTIPVESEWARAKRYAAEAGVTLEVDGAPTFDVTAVPEETQPQPLTTHLVELMNGTGGLVYTDRDDWVHVQTRSYTRPSSVPVVLPPGITMVEPLLMTLDLGAVRDRVTVEYGTAPEGSAVRPAVTVQDQEQIDRYGVRDIRLATPIQLEADATTYAQQRLDQLSPAWAMPDAQVALHLADDRTTAEVCALEQGDPVELPQLLLGSPDPSYTAQVLGYTETISSIDWRITFHLTPQLAETA